MQKAHLIYQSDNYKHIVNQSVHLFPAKAWRGYNWGVCVGGGEASPRKSSKCRNLIHWFNNVQWDKKKSLRVQEKVWQLLQGSLEKIVLQVSCIVVQDSRCVTSTCVEQKKKKRMQRLRSEDYTGWRLALFLPPTKTHSSAWCLRIYEQTASRKDTHTHTQLRNTNSALPIFFSQTHSPRGSYGCKNPQYSYYVTMKDTSRSNVCYFVSTIISVFTRRSWCVQPTRPFPIFMAQ